MEKIKVLALFGKSASGKDTIQNYLVNHFSDKTNKIVSCTTRPKREGEIEGVDYFFLTPSQFKEKILTKEMLEWEEFNNWFYGTSVDQLDINKINIGVFNPAGVRSLLRDPRLEVEVARTAADDKIRLLRSLNREAQPDCSEICRRFLTDEKDFKNLSDIPYTTWSNNTSTDLTEIDLQFKKLYNLVQFN